MANGYARLWLHESEVFDAMKAAVFGGELEPRKRAAVGVSCCVYRAGSDCVSFCRSYFNSYVWSTEG